MRSRWTLGIAVAVLAIITAVGCDDETVKLDHLWHSSADLGYSFAQVGLSREQMHRIMLASSDGDDNAVIRELRGPSPILRTIMWSSLFADVDDPEWRMKMKALHDMNIHGASGVLLLCRPRFCEYPWVAVAGQQGSSDATYDLMRMNPRWMAHLSDVVEYANTFEPPFALQFDFLPHPTLRSGEHLVFKTLRMLLAPVSLMEPEPEATAEDLHDDLVFTTRRNVQGIQARGTELFEQAPTGAWAEVSRNWLRQTVPIINRARFGAVLFVLERTGSEACERWYWNEAKAAGLSPSVYVITNARMSGAIHSPHPHSVSAFRSGPMYASSDGWEPNAREWRQCIDQQAAKGSPAIELWRKEFSDGSGGGDYSKRTRPSAAYIARTCGAVLVEAGR